MIDIHFALGIILGLTSIAYLFYSSLKDDRAAPTLAEGLVVLVSCVAIAVGIKICITSFKLSAPQITNDERTFMFIGGLAVIWICIDAIWKLVTPKKEER